MKQEDDIPWWMVASAIVIASAVIWHTAIFEYAGAWGILK